MNIILPGIVVLCFFSNSIIYLPAKHEYFFSMTQKSTELCVNVLWLEVQD